MTFVCGLPGDVAEKAKGPVQAVQLVGPSLTWHGAFVTGMWTQPVGGVCALPFASGQQNVRNASLTSHASALFAGLFWKSTS